MKKLMSNKSILKILMFFVISLFFLLSTQIYADTRNVSITNDFEVQLVADDSPIFQQPHNRDGGVNQTNIDDIIEKSENFVNSGNSNMVDQGELQSFSATFYNLFLTVGVAIAVIAGMIIGIKYMAGSVEEKATYKQMLLPYLIGCIVVFGAFGIWKLIIEIASVI